jgi:hypothetical protein
MKLQFKLMALLAAAWGLTQTASGTTNSAAANPVLMIDPSSMPVAAGKATLTIGLLRRTNGVYSGAYKINVSPYFFKNERGRLAITVSDDSLAKITHGKVAAVIGTATTSGHGGTSRHVEAAATPADIHHGTIKLWFMAGNNKMIFQPNYHFAGKETAAVAAATTETNLASRYP